MVSCQRFRRRLRPANRGCQRAVRLLLFLAATWQLAVVWSCAVELRSLWTKVLAAARLPIWRSTPTNGAAARPPMGVDSSIGVQTLCLANSPSPGLNVVFFLATGVVQDGESNPPGTALDLRSRCFVVKTLRRTNLVLDLPGTTTVAALKAKIADAEGVPVAKQRLLLGGRDVMDGQTLAAARIMADSTLELVLRLRGGIPKQGESSVTSGALQALVCTCTMVGG